MKSFPHCPFCGSTPRHLEAKSGYYTERVICDPCGFHLPPERWNQRSPEVKEEPPQAYRPPDPQCSICHGTGGMDSGGVYPWGEGISVPCECTDPNEIRPGEGNEVS